MSDPDSNHIRHCLETCEFMYSAGNLPVRDCCLMQMSFLPGVSFAEKTGTFTNTERRIQMVRQAIEPLGRRPPDWQITAEMAKRILQGDRRDTAAPFSGWEYRDTDQIMAEIAALTPSYAGVTHARLEAGESLQWPVKDATHPGTPILHIGQFTRGKGKFCRSNTFLLPRCPMTIIQCC